MPSKELPGPAPIATSATAGASASSAAISSPDLRHYASQSSLPSPASSQIFERSVQDPLPLAGADPATSSYPQVAPDGTPMATLPNAIPTHMMTEDHIPAALDASSIAITQKGLDTDDVSVVTSKGHLPAVEAVASSLDIPLTSTTSTGGLRHSPSTEAFNSARRSSQTSPVGSVGASPTIMRAEHSSPTMAPTQPLAPNVSSTSSSSPPSAASVAAAASISKNDLRRLSFISFADVMHAEHVEHDLSVSQANLAESNAAAAAAAAAGSPPMPGSLSPPQQSSSSAAGLGGPRRSVSPAASLRKSTGLVTGSPLVNATSIDELSPTSPTSLNGLSISDGGNGGGNGLGLNGVGANTTAVRSRRAAGEGGNSPLASRSASASRNRSRAVSGAGSGYGTGLGLGLGSGSEGGEVTVQSLTDVVRGNS